VAIEVLLFGISVHIDQWVVLMQSPSPNLLIL